MSDNESNKTTRSKEDELKEAYKRMAERFVPYDPRFPNQNQTRNCESNYLSYFRCLKKKGDKEYCAWYKNVYETMCPDEWVERWDEQRANGTFPFPDIL